MASPVPLFPPVAMQCIHKAHLIMRHTASAPAGQGCPTAAGHAGTTAAAVHPVAVLGHGSAPPSLRLPHPIPCQGPHPPGLRPVRLRQCKASTVTTQARWRSVVLGRGHCVMHARDAVIKCRFVLVQPVQGLTENTARILTGAVGSWREVRWCFAWNQHLCSAGGIS